MENHIIKINSDFAYGIRFTSDKFYYGSYLWKRSDEIIISMIISRFPGRGHFSKLLQSIFDKGYTVAVPTPIGSMPAILRAKGFERTMRKEDNQIIEVWVK